MAEQKKSSSTGRNDGEVVEEVEVSVGGKSAAVGADVDAMLTEIDEVLEQNAEEFVKSFIQKGGQ